MFARACCRVGGVMVANADAHFHQESADPSVGSFLGHSISQAEVSAAFWVSARQPSKVWTKLCRMSMKTSSLCGQSPPTQKALDFPGKCPCPWMLTFAVCAWLGR